MSYRLDLDEVRQTIATLPVEALLPLQAMLSFLELTPWAGSPWQAFNPDAALRFIAFGESRGTIIYLILEDQRIVDVLMILWAEAIDGSEGHSWQLFELGGRPANVIRGLARRRRIRGWRHSTSSSTFKTRERSRGASVALSAVCRRWLNASVGHQQRFTRRVPRPSHGSACRPGVGRRYGSVP